MRFSLRILLLCLVALLPMSALAALEAPASLRPYEEKIITYTAPGEGRLTLQISRDKQLVDIAADIPVQKGKNSIPFYGLGIHNEPLRPGEYLLQARFEGQGNALEEEKPITLLKPAPAVQYAIGAGQDMYAGDNFIVDFCAVSASRVLITLRDEEDQPLKTWRLQVTPGKPRAFHWDGEVNGRLAKPGQYTISVAADRGNYSLPPVAFTLHGDSRPDIPLAPTMPGDWMPETDSDEALQQALSAPLVVADIGALRHLDVYERPGGQGQRLGKFHGQTQGLKVLSIQGQYAQVGVYRHEDGAYIEGYVPLDKLKTVAPVKPYALVIDKRTQTLSVYQEGVLQGQVPVSTGLMEKNKLFQETHAGAFLLEKREPAFSSQGFTYEYPLRYSGGNLLHGVGYKLKGGYPDYDEQQPMLGRKASHGCVRVPGQSAGAMYWLWSTLPRGTKVLILDDPQQRAQRLMELGETPMDMSQTGAVHLKEERAALPVSPPEGSGEEAVEPQVQTPDWMALFGTPTAPNPQSFASPYTVGAEQAYDAVITLTFGGDCVLGSDYKQEGQAESFDTMLAARGLAWPFSGIRHIFAQDDLTQVNLEVVLQAGEQGFKRRMHNFRGLPEYANILRLGSVESVNLANNHHIDYQNAGRESTVEALKAAGIRYSGYGHLDIFEKDGVKIGFGGIRETTYHQKRSQIQEDIQALQAMGAQYIVYSMHFGKEYSPTHNALQTKMARQAIDLGADLVVGTHPHVVQGIETYNGGLILYSLGNLVFGGNHNLTEFDALLARFTLGFNQGTMDAMQMELIPVHTSGTAPANDFCPVVAKGEAKQAILDRVQADTPFPLQDMMVFLGEKDLQGVEEKKGNGNKN